MCMDIRMDIVSMRKFHVKFVSRHCVAIAFVMRKEHRHEDRHGVYDELGQVVQEEDETNEIGDKRTIGKYRTVEVKHDNKSLHTKKYSS